MSVRAAEIAAAAAIRRRGAHSGQIAKTRQKLHSRKFVKLGGHTSCLQQFDKF